MDVLVIGGAGYIGSHTVLELLNKGHRVTVLDNLSTGRRENLFSQASFIEGDYLDTSCLDAVLSVGCYHAVLHFGALKAAGESMLKPEIYAENNVRGALGLLMKIVAAKVPNFIFSSSAAVYGEPQYTPIDETHPCQPANYYGYTKLQFEEELAWFSRLKGLRYAALRYFNAAGYDADLNVKGLEKQPQNLIPIVMEAARGDRDKLTIFGDDYPTPDGTCIRDYIHVTDLAKAHVLALDYLAQQGQNLCLNLGTGRGYSVKEVVAMASQVCGHEVPHEIGPRREGDPPDLYAKAQRAKELLDWEAQHSSLENIIKTTWAAYQANP